MNAETIQTATSSVVAINSSGQEAIKSTSDNDANSNESWYSKNRFLSIQRAKNWRKNNPEKNKKNDFFNLKPSTNYI